MGVSVDSSSYFQRLSLCETIQRTATFLASDFCLFAQLGFLAARLLQDRVALAQRHVRVAYERLQLRRRNTQQLQHEVGTML